MRIEFEKFIKNRLTYVSFTLLVLIVIAATWTGFQEYKVEYSLGMSIFKGFPDSQALISSHNFWIGMYNPVGHLGQFYYFIFPLLVGIPIVDTIYKERISGTINFELTRRSRFTYYLNKIIFVFVTAFFLFVIPLLLGIILMNLLTGQWDFSAYSEAFNKLINNTAKLADDTSVGQKIELFSSLLATSPYLYILVYYIIGGLYAGAYVCFGVAASLYLRNRFLILFMPFILYIGGWIAFTVLGLLSWDPFNFLLAGQPVENISYLPIIIDFIILLAVSLILYVRGAKRQYDVLS